MTREDNKAIVRRLFEAVAADDQDALVKILALDLAVHHPNSTAPLNREALLQMIGMFKTAFNDHQYTIEDQIAEGEKVATRTTWRATHSGDFQGHPPSGRRVEVRELTVDRIEDGRIVERWMIMDEMGLMQQLGLVPPPR